MNELRRFVILAHDHPVLHWDLMFEVGDVLRTWRLECEPRPHERIAALALAEHRRVYLDYEGPVSGGRGMVACWDRGILFEWNESESDVKAVIDGGRLKGAALLSKDGPGDDWEFVFHPKPATDD